MLGFGLLNSQKGILEWTESNHVNKWQKEYVQHITRIIQTQILVTVMAPRQWRFPLSKEGNMGLLLIDNDQTCLVMNSID